MSSSISHNEVIKDFDYKALKKLCAAVIGLSIIYIILRTIPADVLIVIGVLIVTIGILVKVTWKKLREQGLINLLSPKLQNALLHKSIFDIYCDIIYFPLISEIIKAFISPLIFKPTPEKLFNTFSGLPPKIRDGIATKGLLHLSPSKVESMMLKPDWISAHQEYGKVDTTWYNREHYQQVCLVKPPKLSLKEKAIHKITNTKWHYLLVLSVVMMLVGRKYSQIQIKKFLGKKGIQFGVVLFALSLAFSIKKLMKKKQSNDVHHHSRHHYNIPLALQSQILLQKKEQTSIKH